MNTPLRFQPFLRPMPWGGRRLEDLHKSLPIGQPVGESWEISDHPLHESIVAEGPWAGKSLRELMTTHRTELLGKEAGPRYSRFPWLVKFLDANDWLSVQVHPDDQKAARLSPGEGGKTEAWFVLGADAGSRVYAGLKPGVDERELHSALDSGSVADCLHSFQPAAGDCVFLPAGTVHAVGGGVLLAEVQQTSDATFRLFDWNRRDAQGRGRPLHIEESFASIDWTKTAVQPVHVSEFEPQSRSAAVRRSLVSCPFFELAFRQETQPFRLGGDNRMRVFIALAGKGKLGDETIELGQTWLVPAAATEVPITPLPAVSLLISTLP